jgi:hypothetical protein
VYITRRGVRGRGGLARPIPHPLPPRLRSALVGSLANPLLLPPSLPLVLLSLHLLLPLSQSVAGACQLSDRSSVRLHGLHAPLVSGLSAVVRAAASERWRRRPRTWASSPWTSTSRPAACSRYHRYICFPHARFAFPPPLPLPLDSSSSETPGRHALSVCSIRAARAGDVGTSSPAPAPHALCVIPLRLCWLFTVAAGFSLPLRLFFPSFPAGVSVSGQRERDGGRPPRLQPHRHCCRANCLVCVGRWVISKYRVPCLTACYQGT